MVPRILPGLSQKLCHQAHSATSHSIPHFNEGSRIDTEGSMAFYAVVTSVLCAFRRWSLNVFPAASAIYHYSTKDLLCRLINTIVLWSFTLSSLAGSTVFFTHHNRKKKLQARINGTNAKIFLYSFSAKSVHNKHCTVIECKTAFYDDAMVRWCHGTMMPCNKRRVSRWLLFAIGWIDPYITAYRNCLNKFNGSNAIQIFISNFFVSWASIWNGVTHLHSAHYLLDLPTTLLILWFPHQLNPFHRRCTKPAQPFHFSNESICPAIYFISSGGHGLSAVREFNSMCGNGYWPCTGIGISFRP
jgi:hypothetical protein